MAHALASPCVPGRWPNSARTVPTTGLCTTILIDGVSALCTLPCAQALVTSVSDFQDRFGFEASRSGRPAVPASARSALASSLGTVGVAVKNSLGAMDLQKFGGAFKLRRKSESGKPLPHDDAPHSFSYTMTRALDEDDPKPGFNAWPQPSWWNAPPKWLDALPWWLEGFLQAKAVRGGL